MTLILKVVIPIVWNYSQKCLFSFDIDTFWTLLTMEAVVTVIQNLSKWKRGESIMTFLKISVPYTVISYTNLFKVL